MGKRVVLDVARAVAQRLELGQPGRRRGAPLDEVDAHVAERLLQLRVAQGRVGILFELRRGGMNGHGVARSLMPNKTSAAPDRPSSQWVARSSTRRTGGLDTSSTTVAFHEKPMPGMPAMATISQYHGSE